MEKGHVDTCSYDGSNAEANYNIVRQHCILAHNWNNEYTHCKVTTIYHCRERSNPRKRLGVNSRPKCNAPYILCLK